ncbi:aldose 1-epimerase [Chelatococcus asaccharovorans]|uniref:aldose 1-epimerase n=1 Tax=Chelatococcus asaccharovorans TaxID=28210 RepID=UPI00224C6F33|nr:aldose 1-epimerase [Chelatococcus asaccharovorans]CAH1654294.1 Aldose 1-epimerase [Chelatococcus asaccharovorans]CAH1694613.1 Aldose 1-epimerase [Chelatococcus asaccharovorans]
MAEVRLENDALLATLDTSGGVIWRLVAKTRRGAVPLLRPPAEEAPRLPRRSGCYPLLPFGNRIAGNRFTFEGEDYAFAANTDWDPLVLHGDGWLATWSVAEASATRAVFRSGSQDEGTFQYDAEQVFALEGPALTVTMTIVNRGPRAMPFGFGWHPYLPVHPDTTLTAMASEYWEEGALSLPTRRMPLPEDLDFTHPRGVPRRRINNGFEGWDGHAEIASRSAGVTTLITASEALRRSFIFVPDPAEPPVHPVPFFAFEPMSHTANAHNLAGDGGLRRLAPGESLTGSMTIAWRALS